MWDRCLFPARFHRSTGGGRELAPGFVTKLCMAAVNRVSSRVINARSSAAHASLRFTGSGGCPNWTLHLGKNHMKVKMSARGNSSCLSGGTPGSHGVGDTWSPNGVVTSRATCSASHTRAKLCRVMGAAPCSWQGNPDSDALDHEMERTHGDRCALGATRDHLHNRAEAVQPVRSLPSDPGPSDVVHQ